MFVGNYTEKWEMIEQNGRNRTEAQNKMVEWVALIEGCDL